MSDVEHDDATRRGWRVGEKLAMPLTGSGGYLARPLVPRAAEGMGSPTRRRRAALLHGAARQAGQGGLRSRS